MLAITAPQVSLLLFPHFFSHFLYSFALYSDMSTLADDSSVYRTQDEIDLYRKYDNPIDRLGLYMRAKGWWNDELEQELHTKARADVLKGEHI